MTPQDERILKQLKPYLNEEFLKTYDYHELKIDNFIKTIFSPKVYEPLKYLLDYEPHTGVSYERYLYVKAMFCKLKKDKKGLNDIQKYWDVFVKE